MVVREREFVSGRCELASVRFAVPIRERLCSLGWRAHVQKSAGATLKVTTKPKKGTVLPRKSCLSIKIITTNISVIEN